MALNADEQEIAETLYRQWAAQKQVNCYRHQLCRVAEALNVLSESIKAELEGGPERPVVRRVRGQGFTVDPANQEIWSSDRHDLPAADELGRLTDAYRGACKSLETSTEAVAGL